MSVDTTGLIVTQTGQAMVMDDQLTQIVKARVPLKVKKKVERLAKKRTLSESDIVRESLRFYFNNRKGWAA